MFSLQDIRTIGICGAGQMGTAAAVAFMRAGYTVLVCDKKRERLESLIPTVNEIGLWMNGHIGRGSTPPGRVVPVDDLHVIDAQANAVLDCIDEDLDRKTSLFSSLTGCIDRRALFLSTTSGLSITALGRGSNCGHLLAGTHFWNPAHLMPLVEVIRGLDTPQEVVDLTCELILSIGKTPVLVNRDVPGFIGNRLLHALWREAIEIVERGIASPRDVDLVARLTFGLRLPAVGPLENMDVVGLDLIETIHRYLLADLADNHGPSVYLSTLTSHGHLGVKSGKGFYDWQTRSHDELIERRDTQIVRQLKFLGEWDLKQSEAIRDSTSGELQ